jgi:branched-chain amino acid transport system ATP-binding protein
MLEIEHLVAGYGKAQVLDDVSLTAADAKLTVLTGPNGHGKTTLLRVVSGLVRSWSGSISFMGEAITGAAPTDIVTSGLVHIPQGDLLFQDLSVEQNLLMGAYLKGAWTRRHEQMEEVFGLFPKLRERRVQQARTLSGGERRMCAIGRGLMSHARLLMVDEPALGLAPVLVEEVYATLDKVAQSGTTVLLVEESFEHVHGIADYVYLMESGRIVHHGTVDQLLADERLRSVYLGV